MKATLFALRSNDLFGGALMKCDKQTHLGFAARVLIDEMEQRACCFLSDIYLY